MLMSPGVMDPEPQPDTGPLFEFLKQKGIDFLRRDHPPVYTVEESKKLDLGLRGGATKNLFLRDKKGKRHFLFSVEQGKQVDLKRVPLLIDSTNLSFGSPERLSKHLGILPGAVSLLALINDPEGNVEVLIDEDLWGEDEILCHPLINTSTLALSRENLENFIHQTGHQFRLVQVPQLNPGQE